MLKERMALTLAAGSLFGLGSATVVAQNMGAAGASAGAPVAMNNETDGPFRRIASFPVFQNTSVDVETVAEIVTATRDGLTLVYTDSETENLGFVDISDPANPVADGIVALGGEPTSVGVRGHHALVCINTSPSFVAPSGDLLVVDIETRQIVRTIPLGGQPDAIAISPNGRFAAIAIENERDEDLGNGEPPQLPAGLRRHRGPRRARRRTGPPVTVNLVGRSGPLPERPGAGVRRHQPAQHRGGDAAGEQPHRAHPPHRRTDHRGFQRPARWT